MSKRKANQLGLGDYGSDEEEEEEEEEEREQGLALAGNEVEEGVALLGSYAEGLQIRVLQANAAPDIREVSAQPDSRGYSDDASAGTSKDADGAGRSPGTLTTASAMGAVLLASATMTSRLDDPLSYLPPELVEPPPGQCPADVQSKFQKFLATMRMSGRSINDELRNNKNYRNPDLLTKLVEHFGIKELGSAFPKDVFDPKGLPADDFIGALIGQLEREQDERRKLRERLRPNQPGGGIEFARGTGALGMLPASRSATDVRAVPAAGMQALQQQAALKAAAIHAASKRTKWDAGGR